MSYTVLFLTYFVTYYRWSLDLRSLTLRYLSKKILSSSLFWQRRTNYFLIDKTLSTTKELCYHYTPQIKDLVSLPRKSLSFSSLLFKSLEVQFPVSGSCEGLSYHHLYINITQHYPRFELIQHFSQPLRWVRLLFHDNGWGNLCNRTYYCKSAYISDYVLFMFYLIIYTIVAFEFWQNLFK